MHKTCSLSLSQIKHKYCSIVGSFFEKNVKYMSWVFGAWINQSFVAFPFEATDEEVASQKRPPPKSTTTTPVKQLSVPKVQGFWWWGMVLQHALAPAFLGRTLHYSCIGMHTLFFSSTNTILWLHVRFTWFITNIPSPEIPNPNKKNYHDSFVIWCPFAPSLLPQLSLDNYIYTCCFTKCNEFTNYFFI